MLMLRARLPAILDNPIIWREAMPRGLRRAAPGMCIAVIAAATLVFLIAAVVAVRRMPVWADGVAEVIAYGWAGTTALAATIRCSGAIVRERVLGTWDALILSRLGPRGIILGKLLAALLPLWTLGLALLPALIVLAAPAPIGERFLVLLPAYGVAAFAGISFASLGLYCSMRASTPGGALATAVTLIVLTLTCLSFIAFAGGFVALLYLLYRFHALDKAHRG